MPKFELRDQDTVAESKAFNIPQLAALVNAGCDNLAPVLWIERIFEAGGIRDELEAYVEANGGSRPQSICADAIPSARRRGC